MPDAHQLVLDLLTLGLELHRIGERLPAASPTDSEMRTEGFQAVRGRGDESFDPTFHVILLLFENPDVHHVARNGKIHEHHHAVHMGEGFSFGRYGFNAYVLQQEVYASSRHDFYCSISQRYKEIPTTPSHTRAHSQTPDPGHALEVPVNQTPGKD